MGSVNNYNSLSKAITEIFGEGRSVVKKRSVFGGDINEAFVLTLDDGSCVFMKSNSVNALSNFKAEASGLHEIRKTGVIGVPEVLGTGTDAGFSFLLMEYIAGGTRVSHYWETFASELAAMHGSDTSGSGAFGYYEDNWIGSRKQSNTLNYRWIPFFRDCRLAPQFTSAAGYFYSEDRKRIEFLLSHLDRFLTEPQKPSLVHGDLWSGNMITGNDGKGWLIDPAVYYGHPEVDIAMTELFGGFPPAFYEAYKETGFLQPGYEDRKDLYNLYQLLNHLNMFGSGYLPGVMRIIRRYTG